MAHEGAQECREQILEPVALAKDAGFLKARACGESLEGLDEPMGAQTFEELLDRPGSAFHMGAPSIAMALVPEAHGGDIDLQASAAMLEGDGLDATARIGDGHDGVAGPEIDADGNVVGMGWHGGLASGSGGPDGLSGQAPEAKRNHLSQGQSPR